MNKSVNKKWCWDGRGFLTTSIFLVKPIGIPVYRLLKFLAKCITTRSIAIHIYDLHVCKIFAPGTKWQTRGQIMKKIMIFADYAPS